MRATVVYHYAKDSDTDQEPIACISSYYDPTNETTIKDITDGGQSNNGFNYDPSGLAALRTSPTLTYGGKRTWFSPMDAGLTNPSRKPLKS
jgi:hypothetical protein